MDAKIQFHAIVDFEGRILAGQFIEQGNNPPNEQMTSASLLPLEGQRLISFDLPREVLELPGPELYQFLSQVKVNWPADIQMPKIEIIPKGK
jgi:hypothetical protein